METAPAVVALRRVAARAATILAITVACVVAVLLGWHSPVRTVLALTFALLAPGLALTEMLAIREPMLRLSLAVGASLALETVVALALVYAHAFSTQRALLILAGLTVAALLVALVRARQLVEAARAERRS